MASILTVLGLMSGTSCDGIDAALLRTDGERIEAFGPTGYAHYDDEFRERLKRREPSEWPVLELELTRRHVALADELLARAGEEWRPELVGFHGHTVLHRPGDGITVQLGNGPLLAAETGLPVAYDFRRADVAQGGQGAPLVPVYHRALCRTLEKPAIVVNIGGIANVTYVGEDVLLAFDTGPGNCLLDDWVHRHTGKAYDEGGRIAASGRVHGDRLHAWFAQGYFTRSDARSTDGADWRGIVADGLSLEDGAATLAAFTARSIALAAGNVPEAPRRWIVAGGGRLNAAIMRMLGEAVEGDVVAADALGWNGDALEAQAFAFLAARSVHGLPLSYPETTGIRRAATGGVFAPAPTGGCARILPCVP